MSTSGFSFSSALSAAQAEKTSAEPVTTPQTSPSITAKSDAVNKESSAKGGFSFSSALSSKQSQQASPAKPVVKTSTGFSFSGALAKQQTSQIQRPQTQVDHANTLAAEEWQVGEVTLRCVEKWQETHDVTSFRFQGIEPVKFNYKPGQFITFKLNISGKPVYRSYTIASSPSRPYSLIVTVKQIPGGLVSNYLAKQLNVNDDVTVTGPAGVFNLVDIKAQKYLFLSAGSGVTPMHSMSRWLCDTTVDSDIAFVHSARSAEDIIFADAMASMAQRSSQFSLSYVLEDDANTQALTKRYADTQIESGRLTIEKLAQLVPDYQSRTVFICGPKPYMDAVKSLLVTAKFNMDNFYQESFGDGQTVVSAALSTTTLSPEQHKAQGGFMLKIADKDIPLGADQTLLHGIESAGLPIIAACRSGVCGACKCKVTQGEVSSTSQMTLTAKEIAQGYVLACSTTIKSDVQLSLG
ncbi:FAD-binding oxidoreductase [Shewanella gaetbuli]